MLFFFSVFKLSEKNLGCSISNQMKSVFLPLGDSSTNYSLVIRAAVKHGSFVATTSITTQVSQKYIMFKKKILTENNFWKCSNSLNSL